LCLCVGLKGLSFDLLKFVTLGGLCDIAIVVADHLYKESAGLLFAGLRQHFRSYNINDFVAISIEGVLNLALVSSK
jgi:hypothetical protein